MRYQVRIEPRAKKELKRIPRKYQEKILAVLPFLAVNPFQGKKLHGKLRGAYSYRVWPYRVIYLIYKTELLVIIIGIGHRQGVYQ